MKKWFIAIALFLCFSCVAEAASHEVTFKYLDGRTVTDISSVNIYAPGTTTAQTIYADKTLTNAITQPITTSSTNSTLSNGTLRWWGPDGYDYKASNGVVYVSNADTGTVTGSTGTLYFPRAANDYDQKTACTFNSNPVTSLIGGGAAGGTAGNENAMVIDGVNFEYHIIGTQTITAPSLAAGGLNIGMDQADNDGVEISQGITATSKSAFTVGTDACFMRVSFDIADMNGTDDFAIGFRTAEAYQGTIDAYNNMAVLNVQDANVVIETIDDNASTTSTSTTDRVEDGVETEFAVYVSAAGVVTYTINGSAPTTTAAFTLDDGDTIVPFVFLTQANASQTGVALLTSYECGLQ